MQIDRYNHLSFPRDTTPSAAGKDAEADAGASIASKPQAKVASRPVEERANTASVVLRIQFPDSASSTPTAEIPAVYSAGRKQVTDDDQRMAKDHQLAVDRNAGVFTRISVNKDGVLVAKPQTATITKESDFVALAVSAMREYSDEHDRQKVRTVDAHSAQAEVPWTAFKGLQQFAAKLNVFA